MGFAIPGIGVFLGPNLTPDKMPGPFGAADKPDVFVMTVLPAPVYNGLPPPPGK